jgi:hypothetical protein
MKKIISLIAVTLLVGQVAYTTTSYAAASQESSKSKHSTHKKVDKTKTDKNKSSKSHSKQTKKSKSDAKTAASKEDTSKSNKKKPAVKNNDSVDKSNAKTQTTHIKSTTTSVSDSDQKQDLVTDNKPSQEVAVTPTQTSAPEAVIAPSNPAPVDCLYQLSSTTPISEKELSEWAKLAILKSFDYSFDTLETQLQKLKACYTEQGWLGFNNALKQSGNLATIKAQQLTVNCEIEGKLKIDPFKNNQWKITVPVKVVYQNSQEKLTQRLWVAMVVTKKSASQLGVVQIIAEPKSPSTSKESIAS